MITPGAIFSVAGAFFSIINQNDENGWRRLRAVFGIPLNAGTTVWNKMYFDIPKKPY